MSVIDEIKCFECNEVLEIRSISLGSDDDLYVKVFACGSCTDQSYENGKEEGEKKGYDEGHDAGYKEGFSEAEEQAEQEEGEKF